MGRVRLSELADHDLQGVWLHVAAESPRAADRLLDQIGHTLVTLSELPHMWRSRDELAPGLRSFPVGMYVVFYRPVPHGIEVARVLHGRRDITGLL
jgi:toxin ParE1/3/4